jgi:TetR/AcrR family transcriptional repressor of nem operon
MRVSREVMARHRKDIVAATAKLLRKQGIGGTSVIDLMRAVGLTHGGFYKHFESKDALVAETTRQIYDDIVASFEVRANVVGAKEALAEYVERYLSTRHLDHPEGGCPLAAFGGDANREGRAVRGAFKDGMGRMITLIESGLSGPKRRERAIELASLLPGVIVSARAAGDKALTQEFLANARRRVEQIVADAR